MQHQLDRRIPIHSITSVTLSPLADNFVVLHVGPEFHNVVLELDFKTELVAWLSMKVPYLPVILVLLTQR